MAARASPTIPSLVVSPEGAPNSVNSAETTNTARRRGRSSSLVSLQEVPADAQETLDQGALNNYNADWVNFKGAWLMHVVLVTLGKLLIDALPGMTQEISWTVVNCGYMAVTYLMFHHVKGVPFESNNGAWDELTFWEQIDGGAQYTPARKWLTCVPIGLFLISTHYTKFQSWLFAFNFVALLVTLTPKLPLLHRQRVKFLETEDESGGNTPVTLSSQKRQSEMPAINLSLD
ncbi:hypothetical protein E3P99_01058 [Wallemia hederae]|uniref:Uncharacterized protein n=1 Tax=Wallemia hederae TaxID=1540922 RepID=A0A4T0FWS8_9BASI|nr:hypothetical protein E3P99_01058 [Wallemia hederae]